MHTKKHIVEMVSFQLENLKEVMLIYNDLTRKYFVKNNNKEGKTSMFNTKCDKLSC